MFASLASAVSLNGINLISSPSSVSNDAGSFNIVFNLTNEGVAGNLYYNLSNFTSSQSGLTFSFDDSAIADGSSTAVTEIITATISFSASQTGTITGNINVGNTADATDETLAFSVPLTASTSNTPSDITACSTTTDHDGDLDLRIRDINTIKGFGDDDNFWYPLDEVEVEIKVENNGDDKIKNIEVEWGLYDVTNDDWVIDDKENDFSLKSGKDNTLTIKFKLEQVNDFQENDYVFYVWANGEVNDANNTNVCDYDSQDPMEITNDDDFVILYDIQSPETASCGSEIQITADVMNLGDTQQDEVSVVISNTELGINKVIDIGDINDFDSEILDTFIEIPSDAEEKTYFLIARVYDDNHDIYETSENNDKSEFSISLKINSCSVSSSALISASLESGGKAGENLVVKATITNSGTSSATYTINAAGYAEWASSASIDQSIFTLDKGNSKEILITLAVNKDAVGQKQFNIEVISGNKLVATQPVQVEIQKTSSGFAGITGNVFADGNKYLWGIGILNVILIVFIIIVAIRVARK